MGFKKRIPSFFEKQYNNALILNRILEVLEIEYSINLKINCLYFDISKLTYFTIIKMCEYLLEVFKRISFHDILLKK